MLGNINNCGKNGVLRSIPLSKIRDKDFSTVIHMHR